MMPVFYLPDAVAGTIILSEEESKHAVRVLRLDVGDKVLITNGQGLFFEARLFEAHPKKAVLQLEQGYPGSDHWGFRLHLALAPTKNMDRMEWFVEKATEMGVDEISFFVSQHSERRSVNMERLEKIAVSAMKQSLKSRMPLLHPPVPFDELIAKPFSGDGFIAWIDDEVTHHLARLYRAGSDSLVLIGPEGDFSRDEVERALKAGFVPVSLGKARLRAETAALTAVQTLHVVNQLTR